MNKDHTTPQNSFAQGSSKDKKFRHQLDEVYHQLREKPQTMLQVSFATGIFRANICRYIADLQKHNRVAVVRKGICPITQFPANFYTTDPALFPEDPQSKLFEHEQ